MIDLISDSAGRPLSPSVAAVVLSALPPNIGWHCSACDADGELYIPASTGAMESVPLVMAAHAGQSPACGIGPGRSIEVRTLGADGCKGCGDKREAAGDA